LSLRRKQSVVAVHKKRKGGNWYDKVPRCIKIREEKTTEKSAREETGKAGKEKTEKGR